MYCRDIRNGLGERETVRKIYKWLGNNKPKTMIENIKLIGEFGRWDDIYSLVGTKAENEIWNVVKEQIKQDVVNMRNGCGISHYFLYKKGYIIFLKIKKRQPYMVVLNYLKYYISLKT